MPQLVTSAWVSCSAHHGHYYVYARGDDCVGEVGEVGQDWYQLNDSRVSEARVESFQTVSSRFARDVPYMLFYKKREPRDSASAAGDTEGGGIQPALAMEVRRDNEKHAKEAANPNAYRSGWRWEGGDGGNDGGFGGSGDMMGAEPWQRPNGGGGGGFGGGGLGGGPHHVSF